MTGRLLEGIIESVDEFYSENLAQEVVRGMREEAARRGIFVEVGEQRRVGLEGWKTGMKEFTSLGFEGFKG